MAARSPWSWPISAIYYVVVGYFLIGAVAVALGLIYGSSSAGGMQALVALLVLTSIAFLMRGLRRNRGSIVLNYLEQAVRLNLPLPAMLAAAEQSESSKSRRQLSQLREQLEIGIPVDQALEEAVPGISRRTLALIGAGEGSGRLGSTLARLVAAERTAPPSDPANSIFRACYILMLLVSIIGSSSVLAIFVVPKYVRILSDFNIPVPAATRWFAEWGGEVLPIAAGFTLPILLIYVGRTTAMIFAPRLKRPAVLGRLIDPLLWHLPLTRAVVRSRGLADICNVLGDSLEAGHSSAHALEAVRGLKLNAVLRRRVTDWTRRAEAGMPMVDAARAAGMPRLMVGLLTTAPAGGNISNALRFLARYYQFRFSRAYALMQGMILPLTSIVFGTFALFIAAAMFMPLVALVNSLCSHLERGGM